MSVGDCQTGCIRSPRRRNMAIQREPRRGQRLKARAQKRESREDGIGGRLSFVIPPSRLVVPKRVDFSHTQFRYRKEIFCYRSIPTRIPSEFANRRSTKRTLSVNSRQSFHELT